MAFSSQYTFNIQKDGSLVAEKQWKVTVMKAPSTVPATPTAPSNTTGPLGSSGQADATYTHGDGTSTGFSSPLDAVQKALILVEADLSLGN
jgi:hypothetical protein